jgi:hypothetical protein
MVTGRVGQCCAGAGVIAAASAATAAMILMLGIALVVDQTPARKCRAIQCEAHRRQAGAQNPKRLRSTMKRYLSLSEKSKEPVNDETRAAP